MIYATFALLGATIVAELVSQQKMTRVTTRHGVDQECDGFWLPEEHRILILDGMDPVHTQRVFVHEATHAILDFMNHDLGKDETFVDNFAGHFHQMWTTFEAPPRRKRKSVAKSRTRA